MNPPLSNLERLTKLLAEECSINPERVINGSEHLAEDLGLDSLDTIELVIAAEAEREIYIPEDEFEVGTVSQFLALVERLERKVHA